MSGDLVREYNDGYQAGIHARYDADLRIPLRDQLAMAALTGLLVDKYGCDGTIQGYAERAYAFADAMLKART